MNRDTPRANVQMFTSQQTVDALQVQTWIKPRGCTFVHILCVGGGAGGGGGFIRASGNGGGGGGGGSSGQTKVIVPAIFIPDHLYIQVGAGGAGQVSGGGAAASGIRSYVRVSRGSITAENCLATSGAAAPVGGGTGTLTVVGAAGTAGTIAAITAMPLAGLGFFEFIAGQVGVAGGAVAGAIGGAVTIPVTGAFTMGGSGGAGTSAADFAGGICNATANAYLSEMRPAGAAAGANSGSGGPMYWKPFFSFSGLGGSSSNAGVGGGGGPGG